MNKKRIIINVAYKNHIYENLFLMQITLCIHVNIINICEVYVLCNYQDKFVLVP